MRNWPELFRRLSTWLTPGGRAFIHVFCHRDQPYLFEDANPRNWMARHFFSGGIMPSDDLPYHLHDHLEVEGHWRIDGRHYWRTCYDWLRNLDAGREDVLPILRNVYGEGNERLWLQRWRLFFMACAELFGYRGGREWFVSHYLLRPRG
jgi:cyclopropane-fatty-acyl-phospholipid synthase